VKAAVVGEQHHLDVVDVPDPTPGPDELVLRVRACGICGSDLKLVDTMPAGLVMGHEFCGDIVATGRDVGTTWRDGQLVAALPLVSCGQCRWCAVGEPTHCASVDRVGVGGSAGAFAEYVRVDASQAVALREDLGDHGALVEPLAVGLHTVAFAELEPADRALVIGAGPVGLAVTMWARRMGADEIVVSDPSAGRREAAPAFGASAVVDPEHEELGQDFDVVFECVGAPGLIGEAAAVIRPRGRIVVAGVCLHPDTLPPAVALLREATLRWVMYYTRAEFRLAAALLERGDIDGGAFVTGHTSLDGIDDAFGDLKAGRSGHRKVLVVP
jgi:2-desacetyl-2-hydroxyethyl bacteriochlorophyllide A dehydrogenase